MTHDEVAKWLERYVEAWHSYGREQIGDLFSEDAECRYYPYEEPPRRGREAIVESWFEGKDEPGTFEAEYRPVAVDGQTVVATGRSSYRDEPGGEIKRVYYNCFVMRFDDDGRCAEFTEWFMLQPDA
jgi:ketosteroid isomerase-like protein